MAQPSERAKMLAGELYRSTDPQLVEERRRAQHLLERYNATNADDAAIRGALLRQLFGAAGDGVEVQPRFACDYGYNIRIGRNAFINYNCVFLDCAPIEIGDDLQMGPAVQLYPRFILWTGTRGCPGWNRRGLSALVRPYGFAAGRSFCRV